MSAWEAPCETQEASSLWWTSQAVPIGPAHPQGLELYQRCPRWSSSRHQRFLVCFASTAWTDLPKHCMFVWRGLACFQKNRMVSNHLFISRGDNYYCQVKTESSHLFCLLGIVLQNKQPHGWSGLVTTQKFSLATWLLAPESVKSDFVCDEGNDRADTGCRGWLAAWQAAPSSAQPLSPWLWWGGKQHKLECVDFISLSPKITCRVSAMTWLIPRNIPCSHTGSMEFLSTWISISSPWSHLSIEHSECVPSGIFLWNTLIFKAAFHSNFQNIFPLHLWIHLQADSDFWFISSTCLTGAVLAQCGGEEHTPWIVTLWSVEAFSQITFS